MAIWVIDSARRCVDGRSNDLGPFRVHSGSSGNLVVRIQPRGKTSEGPPYSRSTLLGSFCRACGTTFPPPKTRGSSERQCGGSCWHRPIIFTPEEHHSFRPPLTRDRTSNGLRSTTKGARQGSSIDDRQGFHGSNIGRCSLWSGDAPLINGRRADDGAGIDGRAAAEKIQGVGKSAMVGER